MVWKPAGSQPNFAIIGSGSVPVKLWPAAVPVCCCVPPDFAGDTPPSPFTTSAHAATTATPPPIGASRAASIRRRPSARARPMSIVLSGRVGVFGLCQVLQGCLQVVGHRVPSMLGIRLGSRRFRRVARPREDWLFTLPAEQPITWAVCSTDRSQ